MRLENHDQYRACLFQSLRKSIKSRFNQMPMIERVLSREFEITDIPSLLMIIGVVVVVLGYVKILQNRKNEKYFGAGHNLKRLYTCCVIYIIQVLPVVSDIPLNWWIQRGVEDAHGIATLVDQFSSSGVFTLLNFHKSLWFFFIIYIFGLSFGAACCLASSLTAYTEFVLSKKGLHCLEKDRISILDSQQVAVDEEKCLPLTETRKEFKETGKMESCYENLGARNPNSESKLYVILRLLGRLIKGFIKYMLVVSLFGFLPQNFVFNSTPMIATLGQAWCLKLDHFFFGAVFWFYYKWIPSFLNAFFMKSIVDFSINAFILLNSLVLIFCGWLACFFEDLFFNTFFLSLYFLMGNQEKYFDHTNSTLTLKSLGLLMRSDKFPQCFQNVMSCTQEEGINQVTEFYSWSHGIALNSLVALTTLSLVILPFIIFLVQERRASLF